ncbi:MAG: hypothetical protein A3B11_00315 [Candidatus Taylorbacteria bacterium RIFCSPLOWO2_01_FULL_44_26]|uniref:Type II secretion system protein J n=1 Tax=Candidatus Taylorbacteria bacterium RIFCSPLOWO2_01_FULL_44_26 TaxID=1802318 RepID=A0A1G2N772_9BACT|nr:MAG: hypothetical protein A3B11_00315 [Candidatus Taylorbacteria bacterium RIFCSPLOWO2_01_FULL_44_26]
MFLFKYLKGKRGMTLIEVLTAVAVTVVIMVAVSAFQYNVINYNRSTSVSLTNTQEAQALLKVMAKELRGSSPSENGSYPIAAAATSTLTFFSDIDADGFVDQVRYYLATTTLYRGIVKPTGSPLSYVQSNENKNIIATGIRNSSSTPIFKYFSGTYTGTSTPMTYPLNIPSIRLININITIDTDTKKSPIPRTFSTQATLRNLKDNI